MKYLIFLFPLLVSSLHAVTADELVGIHKVTSIEMNSISTPQAGSLVYNTTESTIFFYTGTAWKKLKSEGSETIINAGNQIVITGNGSSSVPYSIGK